MAPASNEEQFKFLISCIRYSNNGKVDFGQVARECKIVSKGAAAKRYERMMRAHGIAPNAATIKPAPRPLKPERRESSSASTSSAKKRKADAFLEDTTPADDEETYASTNTSIKQDPLDVKEQFVVKEERERERDVKYQPSQLQGQLSIGQAANLMQYYDSSASSSYGAVGGGGMGDTGYGGGDYGTSARYTTTMSPPYSLQSQQQPFEYTTSYNVGGMGGVPRSEGQSMQYQPLMPYQSNDQGGSDSPVIVE